MKIKTIFIFIVLNIAHLSAFSQIDDITWQQCFGTENNDSPYAVAKFNDGYLFGIQISTDGPGITNFHGPDGLADAWIVNTDSVGNILWERCYGGSEGDGPLKIIPIDSNRIYLLNGAASTDGDIQSQNNGWGDLWVVKIDRFGNIIWEDCYGGPNTDEVRDALLTPDGGLLLMARISAAGGDISQHFGLGDVWLCKIDSLGEIQWERTLGNQGHDNALKIELTSDTTFVLLAGFRESGGMVECEHIGIPSDGLDIWIVELDLYGNILRQLCYGGSKDELGYDIIKTNNGYVFTAATTSNDGDVSGLHGGYDIWVVNIDNDGNIIWQNCLGGSDTEYPIYISQTEDKDFMVVGTTWSNNGDISFNHSQPGWDSDIWMIILDSVGTLEWEHCFGGSMTERFWGRHSVVKNSDDNFVIIGRAENANGDVECDLYGFPDEDAWIFEIKDCDLFKPDIPFMPIGPDSLCTTTDTTSNYQTSPAAGAWYYEWMLSPEEAGSITGSGIEATVNWVKNWEGQAEITVRSWNDCGYSDWSEPRLTWAFSCMGISELHAGNIPVYIYPNPASDYVIFETPLSIPPNGGKNGILISDVFGQKVAVLPVKSEKTVWDTREIKAGMYFYRVTIEGILYCGKVIVRR